MAVERVVRWCVICAPFARRHLVSVGRERLGFVFADGGCGSQS